MQIQDLRHRVTLQNSVAGTWFDAITLWAAVEPLSVQATIAARQADQRYTHKITIRYRDGITPDMRVLYKGKVYEIVAPPIDKEERHQFLQLLCVELQITASQMSQVAEILPCIGYGIRAPEFGLPTQTRCRIDLLRLTGYFPAGTSIKNDDRVRSEGVTYRVEHVAEDRGIANVAHVEVKLIEIRV